MQLKAQSSSTGRSRRRSPFPHFALLAVASTPWVQAADARAPAGLLNQTLSNNSGFWEPWDIGGQVRARFERKRYFAAPGQPRAVDFARTGNSDNTYLLLREKFHAGYAPCSFFNLFTEVRDSSSHSDDRNPNPESDTLDLHQTYLQFGDLSRFPLSLKVGRQQFLYGDERLIGAFDWNNIGRVFDAAKLRFENEHLWIDAFAGRVVIPDDDNFNVSNDYDWFWGAYASSRTLCPRQETELYFLGRNASVNSPTALGAGLPAFMNGATPRDIYTLGVRIKSLPGEFGRWDYSAELAGQFGRFRHGTTAATPSEDHAAFAVHAGGGYTWQNTWGSPRVGLEYNFASGDDDPTDGDHGTFENLFPTNHKFYGYMDFSSLQNLHNPRLSVSLKPAKKLSATLDLHALWLADTSDFFYQANGLPRAAGVYGINSGHRSYVGSEVDFMLTYAMRPDASIQGGYSHFFAGGYVEDTLAGAGGHQDADFFYLQLTFNF